MGTYEVALSGLGELLFGGMSQARICWNSVSMLIRCGKSKAIDASDQAAEKLRCRANEAQGRGF